MLLLNVDVMSVCIVVISSVGFDWLNVQCLFVVGIVWCSMVCYVFCLLLCLNLVNGSCLMIGLLFVQDDDGVNGVGMLFGLWIDVQLDVLVCGILWFFVVVIQ